MAKRPSNKNRPGDYDAGYSVDQYGYSPAGMLGRLFGVREELVYPKPAPGKSDKKTPTRKK